MPFRLTKKKARLRVKDSGQICTNLRHGIGEMHFKVMRFEWLSAIVINQRVQVVEAHVVSEKELQSTVFHTRLDSAVIHASATPRKRQSAR